MTKFFALLLSTFLLVTPLVGHAAPAAGRIHVVVYNYADVPVPVLKEAKSLVAAIYHEAGVQLTWHDAATSHGQFVRVDDATNAVLDAGGLIVNLVTPAMDTQRRTVPGVLGFAVPGGRVAWILASRVQRVSRTSSWSMAQLLGVVMAHEIGHLVLPKPSHSQGGLMSAKVELATAEPVDIRFDVFEAELIRAQLKGRPFGAAN